MEGLRAILDGLISKFDPLSMIFGAIGGGISMGFKALYDRHRDKQQWRTTKRLNHLSGAIKAIIPFLSAALGAFVYPYYVDGKQRPMPRLKTVDDYFDHFESETDAEDSIDRALAHLDFEELDTAMREAQSFHLVPTAFSASLAGLGFILAEYFQDRDKEGYAVDRERRYQVMMHALEFSGAIGYYMSDREVDESRIALFKQAHGEHIA